MNTTSLSHKKAIFRSVVVSSIGTTINYVGGIILADIIGFKYMVAGLFTFPVAFTLGYILNRYWAFRHDKI